MPFNCCFIAHWVPKSNPKQAFNLKRKQIGKDLKWKASAQKHKLQVTQHTANVIKSQMWAEQLKRHRWKQTHFISVH